MTLRAQPKKSFGKQRISRILFSGIFVQEMHFAFCILNFAFCIVLLNFAFFHFRCVFCIVHCAFCASAFWILHCLLCIIFTNIIFTNTNTATLTIQLPYWGVLSTGKKTWRSRRSRSRRRSSSTLNILCTDYITQQPMPGPPETLLCIGFGL